MAVHAGQRLAARRRLALVVRIGEEQRAVGGHHQVVRRIEWRTLVRGNERRPRAVVQRDARHLLAVVGGGDEVALGIQRQTIAAAVLDHGLPAVGRGESADARREASAVHEIRQVQRAVLPHGAFIEAVLVVVDGRGGNACRGQRARGRAARIGRAHRTVGGCLGEGRGTAQEQRKGKAMATRHGGPRGQAGCQRTSIRLRPLCLAAYRASSARRTRVS